MGLFAMHDLGHTPVYLELMRALQVYSEQD
jgi:hypothetical protein